MAQPLPYGYTWASEGGQVTGGIRPLTAAEWGAGAPAGPSSAPNQIGAPPPMLDAGGGENVYKDPNGVIRNRREGTPSQYQMNGGARPGGGGQSVYGPSAPAGGGGGGGANNSGGGSTARSQYGGMGGGGGGGGGMALMQDTRMSSALDPSIWNTPITGGSTQQSAGQAGGYASALANLNPSVGAPDRTLYDRYSQLLQDPTMGMNNPASQFALAEAQKATQRQLGAGRMRNSGNALRAMSDTTTGTLMQQFGNLANIYGQGATQEGQRWSQEQGLGLDAQKLKLAGLQGAGDLAVRSGQLYNQNDATGIAARELDLRRSQANILTPNQQQASNIYGQAVGQANAGGAAGYGSFSPSLSQQYLSLTGTPLTLNTSYGTGGASSPWSGIQAPASAPRYY